MEKLDVVASLIHVKVTYHNNVKKLVVIHADLKAAKRIREFILKNLLTASEVSDEGLRIINMFELGVREDEVKPILDSDFEVVQIDDNPT